MVLFCNCLIGDFAISVFILCIAVYLYFKHSFQYWKRLGIPHLKAKFPFGTIREAILGETHLANVLVKNYNYFKSKGYKYGGIYFFNKPQLIFLCPDLIKSALTKDFSHFVDRGFYFNEEDDPLSAHLFSLPGQKWRNLRSKISPTFTTGKLKKMFGTMIDCSYELRECLNDPIQKAEPVDIKHILMKYTTDIIGSCAFGIECNSFKNYDTEFIKVGEKVFNINSWDRARFLFAITFPKLAKSLHVGTTNYEVDRFFRTLIRETVEYREKHNIVRNDFMHLLIQLKNKGYLEDDENEEHEKTSTNLTLNELSAQAFLFFVGGFETSSTAMTWCLFELSKHQEIQDRLREEIVTVLKQFDGQITYDALAKMHYLENVINESMRLYPPFMFIQREVTKDFVLPDTGVVLKQGLKITIPLYAIHLDPEYYPNPEKFDPDRFLEENKGSYFEYTFLPFGQGPRLCIGNRFAMLQMKIGLCQLLLNYKFHLNPKTELPIVFDPYSVVASAKSKILLNVEKVVK